MKEYLKDYFAIYKAEFNFLKKHWKGNLALITLTTAGTYIWLKRTEKKIEEQINNRREEEVIQ